MTFQKTFCSSPWIHTRINNTGNYEYCRWAVKTARQSLPTLHEQTPVEWFQQGMRPIRQALLNGESLPGCEECYIMDRHKKVSGRHRQLIKVGVDTESFNKTMLSSPWLTAFKYSQENNGATDQLPQDWQIDLGNFCNSACLFCTPHSSSRLAAEFKKVGIIQQMPAGNWCDDPVLLQSFVDTLEQSPHLAYLHFIGGETMITPAFRTILQALICCGLNKEVSIGFTTNLTVWDDSIVDLLVQFKEVNLGLSIECIDTVNDYARYGGTIDETMHLMDQWLTLAKQQSWLVQLRITPTILTIGHLHTVYEYAWANDLAVESCNFLNEPAYMRPSVLPPAVRDRVMIKLAKWVDDNSTGISTRVLNTRDPNRAKDQLVQDAASYLDYMKSEPDESHRLPELAKYLRKMDDNRGNSVFDYLPEYEELLRTAGY